MAKGKFYRSILPDRVKFTGRTKGEGVENKALAVWQAGCTSIGVRNRIEQVTTATGKRYWAWDGY